VKAKPEFFDFVEISKRLLQPVIREVTQMIDGAYGTLIDREMPLSIPN